MKIYYEEKPREYTGNFPAITIHYRPQDRFEAESIGIFLGDDGPEVQASQIKEKIIKLLNKASKSMNSMGYQALLSRLLDEIDIRWDAVGE